MKRKIFSWFWGMVGILLLPSYCFSQAPYVEFDFFMEFVDEDVDSVVVELIISEPDTEEVRVYVINEVSSNASIGYDFEMPSPYELIIPANHPGPVSMVIYITDDEQIESNEAIMLAIESVVGGSAITGLEAEHVVWIEDNDECQVSIMNQDTSFCTTSQPVALIGNPSGGTFVGDGVIGDAFYPQLCTPGEVTIEYMVYENLCSDTVSKNFAVDLCSGIEEGILEEVKVYPSVFSDVLQLEVPAVLVSAEVKFIDMTGRVVYQQVLSTNTEQINASSIPSGFYSLVIQNDNTVTTKKVLKR